MSTHDKLELPPLPEPTWVDGEPYWYDRHMEAYARDAIEADRNRRGEPVAWQFYDDGRWWNGDDRIKDHRKNTESAGYETRDLYTHPQPAEPSRDEPICYLWVNPETQQYEVDRCTHSLDDLIPVYKEPQPAESLETLINNQEPLGEEFQRVLDEHSWDLYVKTTEPVKSWHDFAPRQHQNPDKFTMPVNVVDKSTHMWKRIEEYSREMGGKKIDIYLGDFLLYCPQLEDEENNGVVIGYYSEPYKGWYTSETLEEVFPTHFMPLPEKPL